MIIDRTDRIENYNGLTANFQKAVKFALSLSDKPAGRYDSDEFPGGEVYAMVQEGETQAKEGGRIEAHRRYIDVQIMLDGGETVYYTDIDGLKEIVPYNEEKDVAFYEEGGQPARIEKGMFYLALPHDGHMPCRELDGPGRYRKIVLKIKWK